MAPRSLSINSAMRSCGAPSRKAFCNSSLRAFNSARKFDKDPSSNFTAKSHQREIVANLKYLYGISVFRNQFAIAQQPRQHRVGFRLAAEESHLDAVGEILVDQHGDVLAFLQRFREF